MTDVLHRLSWPDGLSLAAIVASYVGWLPHIAAFLSIVWFALKIIVAWQEYRLNKRKLDDAD
jgi:hypothetical protein